jgi:hypothetical protein
MDDRLKSALDVANRMVTFNTQKELIKQEYKENCLYYENGHQFTVNREIINFLTSLIQMEQIEDIVIMDDFENPYMISDVEKFRSNISSIYFESSNLYHHKFIELKKNRSVLTMIGI